MKVMCIRKNCEITMHVLANERYHLVASGQHGHSSHIKDPEGSSNLVTLHEGEGKHV